MRVLAAVLFAVVALLVVAALAVQVWRDGYRQGLAVRLVEPTTVPVRPPDPIERELALGEELRRCTVRALELEEADRLCSVAERASREDVERAAEVWYALGREDWKAQGWECLEGGRAVQP